MQKREKTTVEVEKKAVSHINGNRCVNCGKCEDYCPVSAISECQKEVCHLCPDCTEMKAVTVNQMYELRSQSCTLECPLGISPQGYINLLKAGKLREAYEIIADKNPLTTVCGYICHHPCEDVCKRGSLVDEPLKIRSMKRYLGEMFLEELPTAYPQIHDFHIAVIGAGPAGLTAAHWLAKKGYKVTVFDQSGQAGGMLMRGIPDFRLDKETARREIARMAEAGICFNLGSKINPAEIDALLKRYDKVIVATGLQEPKVLPLEGWRGENRFFAMNFMEKVNAGEEVKLHGNVVVIGGGSVAMDTARTALRLGAEQVTVLCLERDEAVPAHRWEIEEAQQEGVKIIEGVSPTRFTGYSFRLQGVEYTEIKNLDAKTYNFDIIEGTETVLPADFAIIATGQYSDKSWKAQKNILLAGDVTGGKCSVIDAMASGRAAAIQIDNELMGREYEEYKVAREVKPGERIYKIYPANRQRLPFMGNRTISAVQRRNTFDLVEIGLEDDEAQLEALRCLSCGYRLVDTQMCIGCGICQKVCPKGDVVSIVAIPTDHEEEKAL